MTDNSNKQDLNESEDSRQTWWQQPLSSLNQSQWEKLCDGCGKCCLHKLQDEDTGKVHFTAVACNLLNTDTVRCSCYADRAQRNPDCLIITPATLGQLVDWLPATCAYRLRFFGQKLFAWHPLLSANADSVEVAGHSVRHRIIKEQDVATNQDWQELILLDVI